MTGEITTNGAESLVRSLAERSDRLPISPPRIRFSLQIRRQRLKRNARYRKKNAKCYRTLEEKKNEIFTYSLYSFYLVAYLFSYLFTSLLIYLFALYRESVKLIN